MGRVPLFNPNHNYEIMKRKRESYDSSHDFGPEMLEDSSGMVLDIFQSVLFI